MMQIPENAIEITCFHTWMGEDGIARTKIKSGAEITLELIEQAKKQLSQEVKPIDDIRSTEHYRRVVTGNLIARFLRAF